MNDDAITCRFIYTKEELRRGLRCYYRFSTQKWWLLGFCLLIGTIVIFNSVWPDASTSAPAQGNVAQASLPLTLFLNFLPVVFFLGFLAVFVLYFPTWRFRRGAFFNREMIYRFSDAGIHLESQVMNSDVKWEIYTRAGENQHGFTLTVRGSPSFIWLPKSGFDSPESIAHCRSLFRQHLKNCQFLSTY